MGDFVALLFHDILTLTIIVTPMPFVTITAYTVIYIADPKVRSTVYGLGFNLACGLIVSNVLDVCTALANLNERWGGAYVGIYVAGLNLLGFIGIKWCHNNQWQTKDNYTKIDNESIQKC